MGYQNISFPTIKLLHGMTVENDAPTNVVTNFAKEYRINRFSAPKARIVYPARNLTIADSNTLKAFFNSVGWQRDSFNFTVPDGGILGTIKVRMASVPSFTVVATSPTTNLPTIMNISEIILYQVFNE